MKHLSLLAVFILLLTTICQSEEKTPVLNASMVCSFDYGCSTSMEVAGLSVRECTNSPSILTIGGRGFSVALNLEDGSVKLYGKPSDTDKTFWQMVESHAKYKPQPKDGRAVLLKEDIGTVEGVSFDHNREGYPYTQLQTTKRLLRIQWWQKDIPFHTPVTLITYTNGDKEVVFEGTLVKYQL